MQNTLIKMVYGFPRPHLAWVREVTQALFALRVKPNSWTGVSPIRLLLGVEPRLPPDPTVRPRALHNNIDREAFRAMELLEVQCLHFLIKYHSELRPEKQPRVFQVNDRVLLLDPRVVKNQKMPRFEKRYKGP
mmetsp:Transcript_8713/g.21712  ORF Transcript_8713/g.21712 Transcript_8713/m.21712 type:complete len:133 (+) Transcript_8713:1937-2335(+)